MYKTYICIDCKIVKKDNSIGAKRCWNCHLKIRLGKHASNWRGGRFKTVDGYIKVRVGIGIGDGYMLEHRMVMEEQVGRKLDRHEIVHHLNGIRDDNRIENLIITNAHDHEKYTFPKQLQEHIRSLEKVIHNFYD